MIQILLLMILCHIIDDFVLQQACLSKMKQRKWWWQFGEYSDLYGDDYKMALFIHSLSWSISIMLPVMFLSKPDDLLLVMVLFINTMVHYVIDDLKANKFKINLITDQICHFIQVFLTWAMMVLC